MMIEPEMEYEAKQVAELLHISRRKLRRLPIRCAVITRRTILYRGSDLLAYLEQLRGRPRGMRKVS